MNKDGLEVFVEKSLKIPPAEYAMRRQQLGKQMPGGSVAILPSANLTHRNNDTEYPFRQNSNFYYLTGFTEPNAVLVLIKDQAEHLYFHLFCQPSDPAHEVWTGSRFGIEGAIKELGANQAYSIEDLDKMMPSLLENKQEIIYTLGMDSVWDLRVIDWVKTVRRKVRAGISAPKKWLDLLSLIHEQRLIKSPKEIELMQRASTISANAHKRLMEFCAKQKEGLKEYQLEAEFLHECYNHGCHAVAYSSIVAGGKNACILHYTQNNHSLGKEDLVLVDAGGEFEHYAADITRTFPVNGKFSKAQADIYSIVLEAQAAAIALVRPGTRFDQMQQVIVEKIVKGLVKLNILQGTLEELIKTQAYKPFYMHSNGHWLGLDVHDVGEYKINGEWRELAVGMVLTVEPGIYISEGQPGVDKKWWGIGIRIEDDVLVTKQGPEVLTKDVPKTIEAIEKLMSG